MKFNSNLINSFPAFYKKYIVNRDKQVYDFLTESRKVHKYALICYCYGQKHKQRLKYFTKAFEDYTARKLKNKEKIVIEEFVYKYKNFIKSCLAGKVDITNTLLTCTYLNDAINLH